MNNQPEFQEKLYAASEKLLLSMKDMLDYFETRGRMRVSDLHLKVGCPPTYRIDGRLDRMKGAPLDEATMEKLARTVLSEQNLQTLAAEGSVDSSCANGNLLFRLNCFHDREGLAIAVRALERDIPGVEEIGFPNEAWRDIVGRQHGLILVTGITGAGKSTTIASFIDRILATRPCRIITMEDPIEYRLTSQKGLVSQREVGRDLPSYERGLRDCLREDPDVIFVGEMRDMESAAWTLTAAETGHLVFSTLHTRDARGTITRLIDMFPANRQDEVASQLSLGLRYVICQKLLPKADGSGRVVAMEILNNNYAIANLIRLRKIEQIYSHLQSRTKDIPEERMTTMEKHLAQLVVSGVVEAGEAQRWANDLNTFFDEMKHAGGQ
ncbi:MAG: PilT/PilU family type 4a pilus ATPase [Phycisphaerae bacterium]|jgi:twitching motility protein PilT